MEIKETNIGLNVYVYDEKEYNDIGELQKEIRKKLGYQIIDVIRVYKIKDLTPVEAFQLWYNDEKITFGELQFVKENNK